MNDDLIYRLRKRADIRRHIPSRKSVQNNEPDRIADLLEEAANAIELLEMALKAQGKEILPGNAVMLTLIDEAEKTTIGYL
jgi:hypothetical protein